MYYSYIIVISFSQSFLFTDAQYYRNNGIIGVEKYMLQYIFYFIIHIYIFIYTVCDETNTKKKMVQKTEKKINYNNNVM